MSLPLSAVRCTTAAVALAIVVVVLGAVTASAQWQHPFVVSPTQVVVNGTARNVTLQLYPAAPHTQMFLVKAEHAQNCTTPPPTTAENSRTHILTLDLSRRVSFAAWKLDPGTYAICYRNATSGEGYSRFFRIDATVSFARLVECRGGKFGICKVTPATASGRQTNATFTLYYARVGAAAFLMKPKKFGVVMYNCSNPPPMELGMRTPVAHVTPSHQLRLNTFGLEAGTYQICYQNSSAYAAAPFEPLTQLITVSGPIDAGRSSVSCCAGPFLVGERTYCQITTVDAFGNPAGGPADACDLTVCPLTDGRGQPVTNYVEPYFVATGLFEFHFTATGSGCGASAGAAYQGRALGGNKINFFTLKPAAVDAKRATSDCSFDGGVTTCNVTKRDRFSNPVDTCSITSTGTLVCVPTVQA